MTSNRAGRVTVRIHKLPPTKGLLEGVDLGGYDFREGREYEVPRAVADVLIAWDCAERVAQGARSPRRDSSGR